MAVRRQRSLARRFGRLLDLPGDALMDVSRMTVVSDLQLVVENHRGLLGYFPHQVVLRVPEGRVAISGQDLVIGRIDAEEMLLRGKVTGIEYLPADEGAGA